MAIYDLGSASLAANGEVTGVGTTWKAPLTLIRVGATIVFKTEPVQIYTISEIISDTQINVYNPNLETVTAGTGYAILAHDGITVQGLAQDVAETLRYYQSRETEVAAAVDAFNNFDANEFDTKVSQVNTQHGEVVAIGSQVSADATQVAADKDNAAVSAASASSDKEAAAASAQKAEDYAASLDTSNLLRKDLAFSDLTDKPLARQNLGVYSIDEFNDRLFFRVPESFSGVDVTEKLQQACDYCSANNLELVSSGTYSITRSIKINSNISIDMKKSIVDMADGLDAVFELTGAKSFYLKGGSYYCTSYGTNRPQVVLKDYTGGVASFPQRLTISDTQCFNAGICYIVVDTQNTTSCRVSIHDNYVRTDDNTDTYISNAGINPQSGEVYGYITVNGESSSQVDIGTKRAPGVSITDNIIDVYLQSGSNQDICKVGGSTIAPVISGNTFQNRNTNSGAEFDFFTGGLESSVTGNTTLNVGFKFMTLAIAGGARTGLGGRSVFSGNVMRFEKNPANDFGLWLRTSNVSVTGNSIYYVGADDPSSQRIFNAISGQVLDVNQNSFGGNLCAANAINGNTIQLVHSSSISRNVRLQALNMTDFAGCSITGNTLFGGNSMVINARPERNRNVWNGNFIASPMFDGWDVWRMNSSFVGMGNYIGNSYDNSESGIPMMSLNIPTQSDGTKIRLNLGSIARGIGNERCLYILHIKVFGSMVANYQSFIISSGPHDATDRGDSTDLKDPIDSRYNTVSGSSRNDQYLFRVGYDGTASESIIAEAVGTYLKASAPTRIEYTITPLGTNIPAI